MRMQRRNAADHQLSDNLAFRKPTREQSLAVERFSDVGEEVYGK